MKLKLLYLIIFLLIIGCWESNTSQISKNEINDRKNIKLNKKSYNFDNVIKCGKYGYDGIASIGDYGCLYNTSNIYGNINLYLIPKEGIREHYKKVNKLFKNGDKYDKWEKEGNRINNLSILKIKKEFYVYFSLIDKKYLEYTPTLDAPYNIKQNEGEHYKFTIEFYTFNDKAQAWELLDSFETLQKTSNKAWEWEQKKIKEIIDKSN